MAKTKILGVVLLTALLALGSATAKDERRAAKDLRTVVGAVKKGLRETGLSEKELRTRHDFIEADEWRLPLLDEYLGRPLAAPQDAWKRFGPWVREREGLGASLARAGALLGYGAKGGPEPGTAGDLPSALLDLYRALPGADPGAVPSKADLAKDLQRVPKAARSFVLRLLGAAGTAVRERTAAFAELSEAEWVELRKYGSQLNTGIPVERQAPMARALHARIDIERIYRASLLVAAVLEDLPEVSRSLAGASKGRSFHLVYETPAGRVELGGWGPNTYEQDVLLSVDFGGNDTYLNSAGGTLYTPAKTSLVVDLSGDDVYRTTVGLAQGSGMYGVGFLVDCGGNDLYETKNVSQGAGHAGVGVLWDLSGDDRYEARSVSQGAGFFGIGLLRDDEGRDLYKVGLSGQGFGATEGFGILQDRAGNDTYTAGGLVPDGARDSSRFLSMAQGFGQGVRHDPSAHLRMSGGIGLLADQAGDDSYLSDVFGQGCAYWYAIGVLLDGGGRDFYEVYNYGQGAGIHMAVGIHVDLGGDDRYLGRGHALGHALDRGFGFFADLEGNDLYESRDAESQGAAVKPFAVAFFADLSGDDTYRGGGNGYVRPPEEGEEGPWPKGFFLDFSGDDDYAAGSKDAANGRSWTTNRYGFGSDR